MVNMLNNNSTVSRPILMDFPIHIDTISMDMSFLYINLSQRSISSGFSLFANVPRMKMVI